MSHSCVAVFTARSPDRIVRERGSAAWVLDANRARKADYLVCIQNQHNRDRDFSDASEPHGSAFLIGKISDVVPAVDAAAPDEPARWLICISEYAFISEKDAWKGWRNPVHYGTLDEFDIDPDRLEFKAMDDGGPSSADMRPAPAAPAAGGKGGVTPLSMAQAKPALAAFYGVTLDAVEIVIRG